MAVQKYLVPEYKADETIEEALEEVKVLFNNLGIEANVESIKWTNPETYEISFYFFQPVKVKEKGVAKGIYVVNTENGQFYGDSSTFFNILNQTGGKIKVDGEEKVIPTKERYAFANDFYKSIKEDSSKGVVS